MKTQKATTERLQKQVIKELDALESAGQAALLRSWKTARRRLLSAIMVNYREHFGRNKWNLPMAKNTGALYKIEHELRSVLSGFKHESMLLAKRILNEIHQTSTLKHAWILDQVTPDSYRVKLPIKKTMYEADPMDSAGLWQDRWQGWVDSYASALVHNLHLNLINEGSMHDAADEVDATESGTPSLEIWHALSKLYEDLSVGAAAQGVQDVGDANSDGMQEIWQTREDARVCDDCDPNLGLTEEEADGTIPLHPNCRCYWRMVPTEYADLLRSGNADDQALADAMDARGLVPDALAIRDSQTGDVVGKLIIGFDQWLEGKGLAISGQ
jgi:hypothetical protein